MSSLRLDFISAKDARWACEHWHYSKSMPPPPRCCVGVWEDDNWIGVIIVSRGARPKLGAAFGLSCEQVAELTRVALTTHTHPVSRMLSIATKIIKRHAPGIRLIVSYADTNEGHHGGIYQANGWVYVGQTSPSVKYRDPTGKLYHGRQVSRTGVSRQFGQLRAVPKPEQLEAIHEVGKHKYLMPLDADMRAQIEPLRKPYPKRACVVESATPGDQPGNGGVTSDPHAPTQSAE